MGKNLDKVEIPDKLIQDKQYIYKLCLQKKKEYIGFFVEGCLTVKN